MTRRGFTLIELLMTLALMAVLLYSIYSILVQSITMRDKMDRETVSTRSARAVLNVIVKDLQNVGFNNAKPENTFLGEQGGSSDNREDAVYMLSVVGFDPSSVQNQKTELRFVGYKLLPSSERSGRYKLVRYSVEYDPELQMPADILRNGLVLAENIVSFKVTYRSDKEGADWEDTWRSPSIRPPASSVTAADSAKVTGSAKPVTEQKIYPRAVRVEVKLDLTPPGEEDLPEDERKLQTYTAIVEMSEFYTGADSAIWGDRLETGSLAK